MLSRRSTNIDRDTSSCHCSDRQYCFMCRVSYARICNLQIITIIGACKCNRFCCQSNSVSSSQRMTTDFHYQITCSRIVCSGSSWLIRREDGSRRISDRCISDLSESMRSSYSNQDIIDDFLSKNCKSVICPDSFSDLSINVVESYWVVVSVDIQSSSIPHMTVGSISEILNQLLNNILNVISAVDVTTRNSQRRILCY